MKALSLLLFFMIASVAEAQPPSSCGNQLDANSFAAQLNYTSGEGESYFTAVGDLNSDGRPDLVSANYSGSTISVFQNTIVGGVIDANSFVLRANLVSGTRPEGVAIGDLNGDGKPEIVVTNAASNTVSIFMNLSTSGDLSDLSFAPKLDLDATNWPAGVAIGDFDTDGKPDLVVANNGGNWSSPGSSVSVYKNLSSGSALNFAPRVDFNTGIHPLGVNTGDLDGDGKLEIVVATGADSVSILINHSMAGVLDGNSFGRLDLRAGHGSTDRVVISDFDGDGRPDLANVNALVSSVSVFRNQSSPGAVVFDPMINFSTLSKPLGLSSADFDHDGYNDLVIAYEAPGSFSVFRNSGTGFYATPLLETRIDVGKAGYSYEPVASDLDGDGRPDVVIGNGSNSIAVFQNQIGDKQVPVITACARDVTLYANHSGCSAILPNYESMLAVSDNCGPVTITQTPAAGAMLAIGIHPVTMVAADLNGNQTTCTFNVTVENTLAATFTTDNNWLYYGFAGDQSATLSVIPTGGNAPYTGTVSMNRPLICDRITRDGDEHWTSGEGTTQTQYTSCPGCAGNPTATATVLANGGYRVFVTLMQDAIVYATVTDAAGCTVVREVHIDAEDVRCFSEEFEHRKVAICHRTGNRKNPCVSICVNQSAVAEHLAHGDYLGSCRADCSAPVANASILQPEEEVGSGSEFRVEAYPNPVRSVVTIRVNMSNPTPVMVGLHDLTGRPHLVCEAVLQPDGSHQVDVSDLVPGVYVLRVKAGTEMRAIRLIKQ